MLLWVHSWERGEASELSWMEILRGNERPSPLTLVPALGHWSGTGL